MNNKGTLGRLLRTIVEFYPVMAPLTLLCILFNAVVNALPSLFMQQIISLIEESWQAGDWNAVAGQILRLVGTLVAIYVVSLVSVFIWTRLMAIMTQGLLKKLRCKMFNGMQDLPIKYFDTHNHGDIMSYYTNDIDTLRQLVSPRAFPSSSAPAWRCVPPWPSCSTSASGSPWWWWRACCACMIVTARRSAAAPPGTSCRQQITMAKTEGFVEELMNGQKVVKVFCHEEETAKPTSTGSTTRCSPTPERPTRYANTLMPHPGQHGQRALRRGGHGGRPASAAAGAQPQPFPAWPSASASWSPS